jgi:hypothetical protein
MEMTQQVVGVEKVEIESNEDEPPLEWRDD